MGVWLGLGVSVSGAGVVAGVAGFIAGFVPLYSPFVIQSFGISLL